MDNASTETAVATDNLQPVTDSANPNDNAEAVAPAVAEDTKSDKITTTSVEMKGDKLFLDGLIFSTMYDTNKKCAHSKLGVQTILLN